MSLQYIQSQISSVQREIQSLQQRLADKSRQIADKSARAASISQSINSSTNATSIQSKQREIQSINNEIVSLQKERAGIDRDIATKTAKLHGCQQDFYKEQEREQKKFQDTLTKSRADDAKKQQDAAERLIRASMTPVSQTIQPIGAAPSRPTAKTITFDAFISHASEDKKAIVQPLAEALRARGHDIWYDDFVLKVGDSLRRSIDRGLANSRFGIVILSPDFFAKDWPQYELDGLVAKEMTGGKTILPIWHKISKDELLRYSPTLADKLALNTALLTVDELAEKLSEAM